MVLAVAGCVAGSRQGRGGSPGDAIAPSAPPRATVITLERRPCYGTCPVYLVTVAGDGTVTFDGRAHVDSVHRVTARLSTDRVAALVRLFDESQFFLLDDRYAYGLANCVPYATDAPTVVTTITTEGRSKRVEHDHGCQSAPARLGDLERRIDEIVETSRWIGGHGGSKA